MLGSAQTKLPPLLWLAEWKAPAPFSEYCDDESSCWATRTDEDGLVTQHPPALQGSEQHIYGTLNTNTIPKYNVCKAQKSKKKKKKKKWRNKLNSQQNNQYLYEIERILPI